MVDLIAQEQHASNDEADGFMETPCQYTRRKKQPGLKHPVSAVSAVARVCHRYRNTHSDQLTGSTGTDMVLDLDTPWHTMTCTCGIAGTHRYFIMG